MAPGEQLVQHDAEREEVRAGVERLGARLPLVEPLRVRCVRPRALAMPKSVSFTSPRTLTITLEGDTSRWTMPSGAPSCASVWA
jgi:hypothetical protein